MKNTENARIYITNRQFDGTDFDTVKADYIGSFYEKDNKYYIFYKESEAKSCMIKLENERVTVKHSGESSAVMVYEKGKEHTFLYKMPYGALEMKIVTKSVTEKLTQTGGTIHLVYELHCGGVIQNDMKIEVTAAALS